jgi:hypothetical protein
MGRANGQIRNAEWRYTCFEDATGLVATHLTPDGFCSTAFADDDGHPQCAAHECDNGASCLSLGDGVCSCVAPGVIPGQVPPGHTCQHMTAAEVVAHVRRGWPPAN